ncbi:NeuD/PglB/VioB family sugar acetyltransferase [Cryobacterium sp. CG_9.6]|uniref:NeuD/PglB/VioB family sugar acetyltransferase n=1 Tax=Cryobacterium sp. CG_9.6 TaxID=2760710 RepID=UPI0024766D1A|nr:NeuD/PglB/VioB family sugar acetyltransferase [Cryobacterium sp. CG_9.6]MDH6238282.1 sugar O-acyltransferase (sialic acid O-acetyltransferase NeuD family) [Cryobacterium sp. CG_9.6]
MPELLLVGAGGLAREVLSLLRTQSDPRTVLFVDDDPALWGTTLDGVMVTGGIDTVTEHALSQVLLCVGHGSGRARIASRLADLGVAVERYATVIHHSVEVPASCTVGAGSIVLAGAVLTTNVHLGNHVVVMPHVTLTHGTSVSSFATLCAGVSLGGDVRVGVGAYLGMNCSVRQGVQIGDGATVGMAAAVLTDVPDHDTWIGVPAAPMSLTMKARVSP